MCSLSLSLSHCFHQDLLSALQKARSELQQLEEEMREKEGGRGTEVEEREKTIRQLRNLLQNKEKLLEVSHTHTHTHT